MAISDACKFLDNGGEVAVIDATNTTRQRRRMLVAECTEKHNFKLFFVESICDDPKIIEGNILVCIDACLNVLFDGHLINHSLTDTYIHTNKCA